MSKIPTSYSVTIYKNGLDMDFYYCSIYKNTENGLVSFFEKGVRPSEMLNLLIPLPTSSLASWRFAVMGFRRETGSEPLCQRAIKLQSLIDSGPVFTIS